MNKNTTPQILNQTLFGANKRYALVEFLTRFGTLEYFVKDADNCDKNGFSKVVFQSSDKAAALRRFGYVELDRVGIVELV